MASKRAASRRRPTTRRSPRRKRTQRADRPRPRRAPGGAQDFRALFDNMLNGLAYCRMLYVDGRPHDFTYLHVNRAFETLTGLKNVVGRNVSDVIPGIRETDPALFAIYGRVARSGVPERFEVFVSALAEWFSISAYSPRPDHFIAIFDVVTERKVTEAHLALQSAALNAAGDAIVITNRNGTIEWVNATATKSSGYSAHEVLGRNPRELFKSGVHDEAFYRHLWEVILAGEVWHGEMTNRRKDGSLHPEEQTISPVRDANGDIQHFIAVKRDITERKQIDQRLREQAALLDHARDAIVVRDLDHRITYWNKSAERIYGWTAEEALGRSALDLGYGDATEFVPAQEGVLRAGEWSGELSQTAKDGHVLIVESRWTLVRDDGGQPRSILVINTDITERKRLEQQFLRAQRLESIGALASGIAHDLNNVLAPIVMSIDVLKDSVFAAADKELLDTLGQSAQRGADIVAQVLTFARGLEGRRVEVQARYLINEMRKIARETFPKNIDVLIDVLPDLWTLIGDSTQLHQVLLNLCINARDAMPGGGRLTIRAKNVVADAQYSSMTPEIADGAYVAIEVEDTGTGIPRDLIEKIFDPFFTTKDVGRGTGLGLSTSLSIIKSHGGVIRVYSEPGTGSRFSIWLPATSRGGDHLSASQAVALRRGRGELVLVVDDEEAIRQITQQTLEAFGYRVLVAADGAEAVAQHARHRSGIAVVVLDMVMPVMDGPSAIVEMAKIDPALKVIAVSGIAADSGIAQTAGPVVKHFLSKPYSAETLLGVLDQLLSGTTS